MIWTRYAFAFVLTISTCCLSAQEVPNSFDPVVLDSALKKVENDSNRLEIYLRLAEAFRIENPQKTLQYCRKILTESPDHEYQAIKAGTYIMMTVVAQSSAQFDTMLHYSTLATNSAQLTNDTGLLIRCMGNQAMALATQNRDLEAADLLTGAVTLARQVNDTNSLRATILFLGNLYVRIGKDAKTLALVQNNRALIQSAIPYVKAQFQYIEGNANANLDKNREAIDLFQKAYPVLKQSPNPFHLVQLLNNYSITCLRLGMTDSALALNAEALSLLKYMADIRGEGIANLSRAEIYGVKGMLDTAAFYARKAESLLRGLDDRHTYLSALILLADIETERENWKDAKLLTDRVMLLNDSMLSQARLVSVDSLLLLYDVAEKEAALLMAQQDSKIQKLKWQRTWVGITALAIVVFTLLWVFINRKRRQLKLLAHERDQKEQDLALARRELRLKLEEASRYQGSIEKLEERLVLLKSQQLPTEEKLESADIFNILKRNIKEEADWSLFEEYFSNANPSFMTLLRKRHPQLTAHDMRLIALLRLNLNSNEISALFNIVPESVRKARYRLAKKLGLEGEKDLYAYIMKGD